MSGLNTYFVKPSVILLLLLLFFLRPSWILLWTRKMLLTRRWSRCNFHGTRPCDSHLSILCLIAISLWKACGFWKREQFWHHYLPILKYHNFTLHTMKQPYHTTQPSPSAAVRPAPLSRASFIFYFKFIDLHRNYLHLMHQVFYTVCSQLHGLFLCQEALSVKLYWPAGDQRLPRVWVIEQGEEGNKKVDAPLLFLHWACLVHTFYWTKLFSSLPTI